MTEYKAIDITDEIVVDVMILRFSGRLTIRELPEQLCAHPERFLGRPELGQKWGRGSMDE